MYTYKSESNIKTEEKVELNENNIIVYYYKDKLNYNGKVIKHNIDGKDVEIFCITYMADDGIYAALSHHIRGTNDEIENVLKNFDEKHEIYKADLHGSPLAKYINSPQYQIDCSCVFVKNYTYLHNLLANHCMMGSEKITLYVSRIKFIDRKFSDTEIIKFFREADAIPEDMDDDAFLLAYKLGYFGEIKAQ